MLKNSELKFNNNDNKKKELYIDVINNKYTELIKQILTSFYNVNKKKSKFFFTICLVF